MRMKASLALAIFLAFACVSMTPDVSDAARLGGGRSFGSQPAMRQSAPAPTQRPQTMQQRQMQQNAPQQRSGFLGGMGGILGGVLAGTLIGSLLSGGGFSGGGFMDIILLAAIAFIAYKLFSRRRAAAPAPAAATAAPGGMAAPQAPYQPMERTDMQQSAANDAWGGLRSQPMASAEAVNGPTLPAGFDAEEFLRGAKMAYTRLQKAWDSRDLNDIAQFASPAVMEAVREQLQAEPTPTTTELLLVNAQLLEVTQEPGGVERAQVYFDVLMREDPKQETPSSVREIWHFMRENAQSMWRLDGIQQVDA